MKIELNEQSNLRPFDTVHPATCFIPVRPLHETVKRERDVWFKLPVETDTHGPLHRAVNLYTGQVYEFPEGQSVETLPNAKVVIGEAQ